MANYRIVSSDNHIAEPPDLWTSRMGPDYQDRCPQLKPIEDGQGQVWVCDNLTKQGPGQGSNVGKRFENPDSIKRLNVFEDVRPGGYIPDEAIKDMDLDGVDAGIVYPTVGFGLFQVVDSELRSAVFKTYNDFAAEFCGAYPKRLGGIAMINIEDIEGAVSELERCRNLGFVGGMIASYAPLWRPYDSTEYDPIWAAAQDLDFPLGLHAATNAAGAPEVIMEIGRSVVTIHARVCNMDHYVRMSLSEMIYSGVFQRFPRLQIGSVEFELSWIPHFLDRLDFNYTQRGIQGRIERFKNDMIPSDFFHRNVFVGFQEDALGIKMRDIIGVDNLQWGSDYPHTESTFPKSREILEEILVECTDEEKAKIAGGNAARIYKI